jgi:ADP-ribose pyrophosphatase
VEAAVTDPAPPAWEVIARHEVADRRPWLRLWAEDVRLPDGRTIEGFLTIDAPDVAATVALTPDGQAVISRNYKHGPRRVCINLPAGYLNPGEEPLAAARRELLEETGYVADEWIALSESVESGNRGSGRTFLFLARGARRVAEPDADDLEELQIGLMPLPDLAQAVRSGEVAILSHVAAIGMALVAEAGGWAGEG